MKPARILCQCLLAMLLVFTANAQAQVKTWVETPGVMIMPDRTQGEVGKIELTVVRNQYASAQIGLRTETAVDKPLSFDWTPLASAAGGKIGHDQITLYRAAEINVDHGGGKDSSKDPARARPLGDFPDALVPLILADGTNVANTITPDAGKTISFWVDIFIPPTATAGDYEGTITLKSADQIIATIPVKLSVLNIEIPAKTTLPSLFNLRPFDHVKANMDAYVAEVMKHRIQPFNYHYLGYMTRPGFGFDFVDKYNPNGEGWACVYVDAESKLNASDQKELLDAMHTATAHLKEKKLFDKTFLYLKDEPDQKEIPFIADAANMILKDTPEWKGKLLDTLNSENNVLDPMLDYTVRALKCYGSWYTQNSPLGGREEWDKRRADGKHLWFYVSNAQGVPFPTFDVNTPNLAFEPRVLGWAYWYEKAEGHLYWDLLAGENWSLNKKFPPGDGQLIYPGNFDMKGAPSFVLVKDIKEPVVSRRLKMQRQGLEDYELLKMAEAKVGRDKVAAIVSQVYTCLGQRSWAPNAYNPKKPMWSYSEKDWDNARQQVLDLLK